MGDTVTIAFTGGEVNPLDGKPYMLQAEGQPQFERGSQYFLALVGPNPDGNYFAFGGSQGRYTVVNGELQAVTGTADQGSIQASLDSLTVDEAAATLTKDHQ